MTSLVITPGLLLIAMVAFVVGYLVLQNSKKNSATLPATGDLGAAIGAGAAVAMLLVTIGWAAVPTNTAGPATGGAVPTCSSSSISPGC
ncbi:hypothetical protein ACGF5O_45005 [Streptomyces sp. NPDC048291]|uniref:hypothetical protein n=1 Tax=Streptomyces sp. NPDC048291 TaxID=3365530 RepID=UPI0037127B77